MTIPLKNIMHDKVKNSGALTDAELTKALNKDGILIAEDRFNKVLLELEIMGLVKVSWLTKDTKRIEIIEQKITRVKKEDKDDNDNNNTQDSTMPEKDYEASFPGAE
jgi:hypothetical protein